MQTSTRDQAQPKDRTDAPAIEPAAVLPAQLGTSFGMGATLQPEKRLMLAVLEDAVTVFLREATRDPSDVSAEFLEAQAWILSEEAQWPFSFENISRALGLEPTAIRRGLREWRSRQLSLAPARRTRVRSPFRRMNGTRTKTRAHAPGLKVEVA